MQGNNPLKMNDWGIGKFIKAIFVIQVAVLGIIGLEMINIHIPILRELIPLIYLLFVPGILILRIFRIHKLNTLENLLYSVGLSITSLMFVGFFMNITLPFFKIVNPLSFFYLIWGITFFTVLLCIISYIVDKNYSNPDIITVEGLKSFKTGFICLIPFLAILGTYLMNFYHDNVLLMIMIFLIALLVILVAFDKIPENKYPLVIFIISLSLLFHTSLISQYLWGWDIHHEYYLASQVMNNSIWDLQIQDNTNAMLSIVMLAPILSQITSIDLVWVFKIVYPFIFALVPLGLYQAFKEQMNSKIAFLSAFFFMSIFTFFTEMNQLARQQIAELFLVLIILLLVTDSMSKMKRVLLTVIFAISIVVSHYGLSYIFMLSLCGMYLFMMADDKFIKNKIFKATNILDSKISMSFVLLFVVFTLLWYMYISGSFPFNTAVDIINQISGGILTDFLNPYAAQGAAVINAKVYSPILNIPKNINLMFQFFILLGVIFTLYKIKKTRFKVEFMSFSLMNLMLLVLSVVLPFFASALNITRIYHIALFFLAPFAIIGGLEVFKLLSRVFKRSWTKKMMSNSLKVLAILLVIQLLFYTGFIFEIANDEPSSFAFCGMSSFVLGNMDYPVGNSQEVGGLDWLYSVKDSSGIYADEYRKLLCADYGAPDSQSPFSKINGSYIFLGKFNLDTGTILVSKKIKATRDEYYINYWSIIENKESIYDNGNAEVFI